MKTRNNLSWLNRVSRINFDESWKRIEPFSYVCINLVLKFNSFSTPRTNKNAVLTNNTSIIWRAILLLEVFVSRPSLRSSLLPLHLFLQICLFAFTLTACVHFQWRSSTDWKDYYSSSACLLSDEKTLYWLSLHDKNLAESQDIGEKCKFVRKMKFFRQWFLGHQSSSLSSFFFFSIVAIWARSIWEKMKFKWRSRSLVVLRLRNFLKWKINDDSIQIDDGDRSFSLNFVFDGRNEIQKDGFSSFSSEDIAFCFVLEMVESSDFVMQLKSAFCETDRVFMRCSQTLLS